MRPTSCPALIACALIAWALHALANAWRWVKYAAVGLLVALMRAAAWRARSLAFAALLAAAGSGLAADRHEDFYVQRWCAENDGVPSERAPNGERIDCLTPQYVAQFAKRGGWREAAWKALAIALVMEQTALLVAIYDPMRDGLAYRELMMTVQGYDLPIEIRRVRR